MSARGTSLQRSTKRARPHRHPLSRSRRGPDGSVLRPLTEAEIEACALDYIEGWYAGDAARMARALHPELAKRVLAVDEQGRETLRNASAALMLEATRQGRGKALAPEAWGITVRVEDVFPPIAAVRVDSARYVDYLHVVHTRDGWKVVNVLWHPRREPSARAEKSR
jgi:Putative lumazine-binding